LDGHGLGGHIPLAFGHAGCSGLGGWADPRGACALLRLQQLPGWKGLAAWRPPPARGVAGIHHFHPLRRSLLLRPPAPSLTSENTLKTADTMEDDLDFDFERTLNAEQAAQPADDAVGSGASSGPQVFPLRLITPPPHSMLRRTPTPRTTASAATSPRTTGRRAPLHVVEAPVLTALPCDPRTAPAPSRRPCAPTGCGGCA
jgi:hypothetical protein